MKVSVLTPTLNRPEFLERAIASVVAQTYQDWELIVQDGSDEPLNLQPEDPRIRYFYEPTGGPAEAFQRALDKATGDLVTPLSDDDRLTPDALQTAVENLGDALWLYGQTELQDSVGTRTGVRGEPFDLAELRRDYYLGGAVYWRRALTDRLGGFDRAFDGAADYDLYLRFAEDSVPVFVPKLMYLYTDHPGTDTNRNSARQGQANARVRQAISARLTPSS